MGERWSRDPEVRWQRLYPLLEANAVHLAKQGSLAVRHACGRRVWLLRFKVEQDGRRVQRAVYIGGDDQPELLQRVKNMLVLYRDRGHWTTESAGVSRFMALLAATIRPKRKDQM